MRWPSVTCLCVTENRKHWLPSAVERFRSQDYPGKLHLLFVTSDLQSLQYIREMEYDFFWHPYPKTIGAKRNIGCEAALSDVMVHWDDDDYSAPGRVRHQVEGILDSGKSVVGYHSLKFSDGENWWQYSGSTDFAAGCSLAYRREFWQRHQFIDANLGEDVAFSQAALVAGELATSDSEDMLYASIHPGNTAPRWICGISWREIAAPIDWKFPNAR